MRLDHPLTTSTDQQIRPRLRPLLVFMHNLATDSRGNLYVSEVGTGRRVQKFVHTR